MTKSLSRWYDRPFRGVELTVAIGPVAPPALGDLRHVVAQLIRASPDGPAGVAIHGGLAVHRDGVDAGTRAAAMVQPAEALDVGTDFVTALADRAGEDFSLGDLPFQMRVGPDFVLVRSAHVVGDAGVANALMSGLLLAAAGGELPSILLSPTTAGVSRSVATALVQMARPMPRCHPVHLPTAAVGVWSPSPAAVHSSYADGQLRRLKTEARRLGVRRSSLLVALVEEALEREGIAPVDDVRSVVVDCRRYLPAGSVVRGSFSAGEGIRADWRDPVSVDEITTSSLERARPLVQLVMGSVLSRLPGKPVRPVKPGTPVRVRPDYSVAGPMRGAGSLPWTDHPNYVCLTRPYRPDVVGVIATEVGSTLQVSMGFDGGFVPREVLLRVLRTLDELLERL